MQRPDVTYTRSPRQEPPTVAALLTEAHKRGMHVRENADGTYSVFTRNVITGKIDAERTFSTRLSAYSFLVTEQSL